MLYISNKSTYSYQLPYQRSSLFKVVERIEIYNENTCQER